MKKTRLESELLPSRRGSIRAIALLSGGLDSSLAAAIVRRAGIEVTGLTVHHLFTTDRQREKDIATAATHLGIPVRTLDLTQEHLDVVRHPRHGYGAGMNPCIDCRVFMLRAAKRMMEEENAQFVVTGEVVNQRPMSQNRRALDIVAEESGLGERLLRPLSANILPDTLPVKERWIAREDLFSISGRGRQEQMALAVRLGLTDYPSPAGGCILTEKVYAARLRDAFAHRGKDTLTKDDFLRLRYGRHFRLSDLVKVIVGRNEAENKTLAKLASEHDIQIEPVEAMGPLALLEGAPRGEELRLIAALVARYCDHEDKPQIKLRLSRGRWEETVTATPMEQDDPRIRSWRI